MAIKLKRRKKKKMHSFFSFFIGILYKIFKFLRSVVRNYFFIISVLTDLVELITLRIIYPIAKFLLIDLMPFCWNKINDEVFDGNKYLTFFSLLLYFFMWFFIISNIGFVAAFMLVL
jgi:hypothetical protein